MARRRKRPNQRTSQKPKQKTGRVLTRRRFIALGTAAVVGIAVSAIAPKMLRRPEPAASTTRPAPATRKAMSEQEHWRQIAIKRTKTLNPFVMQHLPNFENAMNKYAEQTFARFKRAGKEQGGYVSYNPKTRQFKVWFIEDLVNKELAEILKRAQNGDFSEADRIIRHLKNWSWADEIKQPSGKVIPVTGNFLIERFRTYQKLWQEKRTLEKLGRKTEAEQVTKQIGWFKQMFNIMHNRLILSEYDAATALTNLFPKDSLFEPNSEKRFFAHFHTHPALIAEGKTSYGGPISKTDLKNTVDYGPSIVFELGKDYNAVHVGANGKIVFSKRFPIKK